MKVGAWAFLAVLLVALAGCADAPEPTSKIRGGFTHDRTNADLEDFDATLEDHNVTDYGLMESFPEQFILEVPEHACAGLLEALQGKPYLSGVRGC